MSFVKKLSAVLLLVASAQAQFGPSVSSSGTSLGPAPTESIGCRVVDGEWQCAAPRTASQAVSTSSASSSAAAETSETPSSTTPNETSGIPAPPAESTGCVAHGDHYHCEGPAEGYEDQTPTNTAEPSIPSPTESSNCVWRESHDGESRHGELTVFQISVTGTVLTRPMSWRRLKPQRTRESASFTVSQCPSRSSLGLLG